MDWTGCELVECVPGRVSGQPTVVGTRVMPDVIVEEFDDGMSVEDIWDNYPSLTPEMIRSLIAFQHQGFPATRTETAGSDAGELR